MLKKILTLITALAATACFAGVEINTATEAELDSVKGLGPAGTGRILKARSQGDFKNWADFMGRVKGFKPANATKLSNAGLTVQGESYPPPPAAK